MMINLIFAVLVTGFLVGLVGGLVILSVDHGKGKVVRKINIKGITLEYNYSKLGIYESLRALIDDQ